MSVIETDLHVDQYADFSLIFPIWLAGGIPVDFTGATAVMMVRANPTDATAPLVNITTTPSSQGSIVFGPSTGGAHGDVPAGAVQINIAVAQLGAAFNTVPVGEYDLDITWSTGLITDYASGRFLLKLSSVH